MPWNHGDVVRCIARSGITPEARWAGIIGQEYIVEACPHRGCVNLQGIVSETGRYLGLTPERFELVRRAAESAPGRFILWNAAGHPHNVQGRHSYTHDEAVAIAQEALAIDGTRVLHLVPLRSVHVFQR